MTDEGQQPQHDSLDLEALVEQGRQYKAANKAMWRRAFGVIGVIVFIALILWFRINPNPGELWIFEDEVWAKASLDKAPVEVKIAENGTVWVNTANGSGLYSFDGTSWQDYHKQFDLRVDTFDIFGNKIWAVVNKSIYHFDGDEWIKYEDVLPTDDYVHIAAGNFGVIAIDMNGNITQYADGIWDNYTISDVLPSFQYEGYEQIPQVERTTDTVWISYLGFWYYDSEDGWQTFYPNYDSSFRILGDDGINIWFTFTGAIVSFEYASYDYAMYDWQELGLSEEDAPRSISRDIDGAIWLLSERNILKYDGVEWNRITTFPLDMEYTINDTVFDYLGRLWVTTVDEGVLSGKSWFRIGRTLLSCTIIPLLVIAYLFVARNYIRKTTRRSFDMNEQLKQILPELNTGIFIYKENQIKGSSNWAIVRTVIAFAGLIGSSFLPIAPMMRTIVGLIWVIILLTFPLINQMFNRANKVDDRKQFGSSVIWFALYLGIYFVLFSIAISPISTYINNELMQLFLMIPILAICGYLTVMILRFPIIYIYRGPLAKGDYDNALSKLEQFSWTMFGSTSFVIRGHISDLNGTADISEQQWLKSLEFIANYPPIRQSAHLVGYGIALMNQTKFDQALPILETALKISPEHIVGYTGLITYYRIQKIYPDRALELAEAMLLFLPRKPIIDSLGADNMRSECFVLYARALANVGRYDEANEYVEKSLKTVNRRFKPALASTYLELGKIKRTIGEDDVARDYFQQAADLDTQGYAGSQARGLLADKA